ncbi:hypothetical protein BZA77DRAFT_314402 [Pyronema omphalodes]|nr:hypothetical protein BZA77DRAFT_314402 [Pyronema omphalodes]
MPLSWCSVAESRGKHYTASHAPVTPPTPPNFTKLHHQFTTTKYAGMIPTRLLFRAQPAARNAVFRQFSTSQIRRNAVPPPPPPAAAKPTSPHISIYKDFGRPFIKVFLMAVFVYQTMYWGWMKMEKDELKKEKNEVIRELEEKVQQARENMVVKGK